MSVRLGRTFQSSCANPVQTFSRRYVLETAYRIELDCGNPSKKSAKSKPVPATGEPPALDALVNRPVKLKVPRPFGSVQLFRSLRVNWAPKVKECSPCARIVLSPNVWLWLRVSTGGASLNPPKLVKVRFGGP